MSLANAVRGMVLRGKVLRAALNPRRTLLQLGIRGDETKDGVELLLPYGMSALPLAGDALAFAVMGLRDHVVALCADDPALRIADLQPGEFGFRDARGQQVVFRLDRIEVTTPLKLVGSIGGDLDLTVGGAVTARAASWNLTGPVAIDGDVTVTGNITASGTIHGHVISDDHATL